MLREKYSFEFHNSIYNTDEIQQLTKVNDKEISRLDIDLDMNYRVVERATNLSSCISNLCSCFVEGQKTRELAKRINYAKKALDNMVIEERIRANIEVEEFMKQSQEKIKYMEKNLNLKKVEIRKLAEDESKKFDDKYEINRMKKDIIIKQRRELKDLLDNSAEVLKYINSIIESKNDKRLLQANEMYRVSLRDYKYMVKIGRWELE